MDFFTIYQILISYTFMSRTFCHTFYRNKSKIMKGIYNGGLVKFDYEKGMFNIDTIYNALIVKSVSQC